MHKEHLASGAYLLGTPDTKRKGLSTRNARRAFTSNPFWSREDRIVLIKLKRKKQQQRHQTNSGAIHTRRSILTSARPARQMCVYINIHIYIAFKVLLRGFICEYKL